MRLTPASGACAGFVGSGSNGVFTAEAVGCLPTNETTIADAMKPSYMTGETALAVRLVCAAYKVATQAPSANGT